MIQSSKEASASLRWGTYAILIALAVGNMSGRILAVNSVDNARLENYRINARLNDDRRRWEAEGLSGEALEQRVAEREVELQEALRLQRPFLSSNDRSRWMAVRALVEHGTYAIDKILEEPTWDSIDIVKHQGRDGRDHLYSSKPPLLATLIAGEYWLIHKATGKTVGTHPYELGRLMVFTLNVIPFAVMLLLLAAIAERLGRTDFGRVLVMATAALGTFLTAFATVLNNHLPAAVSVTVTLYALVRIWQDHTATARWYVLAGLAAAFTAACELPALAFLGLIGLWVLWRSPWNTLVAFVPAVVVVAAAFFGTNYVAHDSWRPPYAHRSEDDPKDNWYEFTYTVNGRERESYWSDPKGIDRGEPSKEVYALHVLVGHHGIFSLTPMWLLSVLGCMMWLIGVRSVELGTRSGPDESPSSARGDPRSSHSLRRILAFTTAVLTIICLVFFIVLRPQQDRNYGGMTGGFRWMFWFAPMWLLVALPAADWLGRTRIGKWFCCLLLALSVLSVAYLIWNPWQQPWLAVFMEYLGWVEF